MIALYAAALDPRIEAVCVSGYFDDRNDVWRQPVDRNVFGLLEQFGDAEVASLIAPRTLVVEAAKGPEFVIPPGTGGAPGRLTTPKLESVKAEVEKARRLVAGLNPAPRIELVASGPTEPDRSERDEALSKLLSVLDSARRSCEPVKDQADRSTERDGRARRPARSASFTSSTGTTSSFWSRVPTSAASS